MIRRPTSLCRLVVPALVVPVAALLLLLAAFVAGAAAQAAPALAPRPGDNVVRTAAPAARGLTEADFPRVQKVAENVYTYEALRSAGEERFTTVSMFVVTNQGVLVADGQGNAEETQRMVQRIAQITSQPITHVVICSDHGDHTGGNSAFPAGATFWAHPTSKALLEGGAGRAGAGRGGAAAAGGAPAGGARGRAAAAGGARGGAAATGGATAGAAARGTGAAGAAAGGGAAPAGAGRAGAARGGAPAAAASPARPIQAINGDMQRLTLGGTEIQLLFLGRAHTGGDLSVYVPSQKVLFMSEAYLNHVFPAMRSAFPTEWVGAIQKAQAMDVDVYIPGHGFVESNRVLDEELERYRQAMNQVIAEAKRLHAAGRTADQAVAEARFGDLEGWTLHSSQAATAVRRVYAELNGELPPSP